MPRIVQQPQLVVWFLVKLIQEVLGEVKAERNGGEDFVLDLVARL